jgi:hypothetical protein
MVDSRLRLIVDFNYGGGRGPEGVVFLSPKAGDRSGLKPDIQTQFDAAGVVATVGMTVRLVDPHSDQNLAGDLCDLEADGTLERSDAGPEWKASYRTESLTWVPVKQSRS